VTAKCCNRDGKVLSPDLIACRDNIPTFVKLIHPPEPPEGAPEVLLTGSPGLNALFSLPRAQPERSSSGNVLSNDRLSDNARLTLTHFTDDLPSKPLASRLLLGDQAIDRVMADLGRPSQEHKGKTERLHLDSVLDDLRDALLEELALTVAR